MYIHVIIINEIFVPSTLYGTMPLIWRLPSIGNFTSVKFSSIEFNLLKNHGKIFRPFAFIRFARDFNGDSSWRLWLVRNITNAQYQPTQNPHHNLFAFLRKSFIKRESLIRSSHDMIKLFFDSINKLFRLRGGVLFGPVRSRVRSTN